MINIVQPFPIFVTIIYIVIAIWLYSTSEDTSGNYFDFPDLFNLFLFLIITIIYLLCLILYLIFN